MGDPKKEEALPLPSMARTPKGMPAVCQALRRSPNMNHLKQMIPSNSYFEVGIITPVLQTRKQSLREAERDASKIQEQVNGRVSPQSYALSTPGEITTVNDADSGAPPQLG